MDFTKNSSEPSPMQPPNNPPAAKISDNEETLKEFKSLMRKHINRDDYVEAYNLCLDYIDDGLCVEYAQRQIPMLEQKVRAHYKYKRILHLTIFAISAVIAIVIAVWLKR
ncbi:MAG: hypothetical protein J6U21_14715 [Bacteroidales bacterium]|nr:hypothetical protein [Bacteroidales bacterium]